MYLDMLIISCTCLLHFDYNALTFCLKNVPGMSGYVNDGSGWQLDVVAKQLCETAQRLVENKTKHYSSQ